MEVLTRIEVKSKVKELKAAGKKIVFTNGCFDIIHQGHTTYLSAAGASGDFLIIGLNSDTSVSQLKGPGRPVNGEVQRAANLLALSYVDAVTIFSEKTPEKLIDEIRPHILVKGGDYDVNQVVGADRVRADGGEVVILPFVPGFSTTKTIENQVQKGLTEEETSN
jgi:D-beta-D-heptose 7-phosphate kinase/D-beta-D-heptose 1-phosphate adenosyltransferase